MVSIIDIKTSIYNQLSAILKTFEYGRVPKDETFPYITYHLPSSTEGDTDSIDEIDYLMEVTILDHNQSKDTTTVENLVSQVSNLLSYKNIKEPSFYWYSVRQSIINDLPTPDEYTFRRELNFNITVNESEVS